MTTYWVWVLLVHERDGIGNAGPRGAVAVDLVGVIGKSGRNLKEFSGGHQIACPSETEIYVAESSNWRVQKLLLRP